MKTLIYFIMLTLMLVALKVNAQYASLQIFPTPQEITVSNQSFTPSSSYYITGLKSLDADAVALIKESLPVITSKKGLPIRVSKLKDKQSELQRSGAYRLIIQPQGIAIEIADDRSLFYAAQTIKQLIKRDDEGRILLNPCKITDYPDVNFRGIVEGFYGKPWDFEDRMDLLRYFGKLKLNTYIYGPKDDPYHRFPSWRDPYPSVEAKQIIDLVAEASRNKVDFVWAMNPGKDIKWNAEDSSAVLNKLEKMYSLGVRSFALFFDDIAGEGTRPEKQAGLLNYINKEFVQKKGDIKPLLLCPTEFNREASTAAPDAYLDILGNLLDPSILIMWTGDKVVGDITLDGIKWVNNRIKRNPFIWWNFPVSDYVRDHLLMGPAYGIDKNTENAMSGFVANPMDKSEASKVGIFGVAMYAWNLQEYDVYKSWEEACRLCMPEAPIAYLTFCSHNSDPGPNGHNYRREESVQIKPVAESFLNSFMNDKYLEIEASQLNALFSQIAVAPTMIYSQSPNKNLIKQINPWLRQFELLGNAGTAAMEMANAWTDKDEMASWQKYTTVTALLDSIHLIDRDFNQNEFQPGVKTGSLVIMPFIQQLYKQVGNELLAKHEDIYSTVGSTLYSNIEQLKTEPISERNNEIAIVPVFQPIKIKAGQYVGIKVAPNKEIETASFNLPLSSNGWRLFECSEDGVKWTSLQLNKEENEGESEIARLNPQIRYVRMRNNSNATQSFFLMNFSLQTKIIEKVKPELLPYDKDLKTYQLLTENNKLEVDCKGSNEVLLFMSGVTGYVRVEALPAKGDKFIIYQGGADFVKLTSSLYADATKLYISSIHTQPIRIHEIVKK